MYSTEFRKSNLQSSGRVLRMSMWSSLMLSSRVRVTLLSLLLSVSSSGVIPTIILLIILLKYWAFQKRGSRNQNAVLRNPEEFLLPRFNLLFSVCQFLRNYLNIHEIIQVGQKYEILWWNINIIDFFLDFYSFLTKKQANCISYEEIWDY